MMSDNLNYNLQSVMRRMHEHNHQLATGRRVSYPSDDPVAVESIMRLKSLVGETEQYLDNVRDGLSWLSYTDSALGQIGEGLQRARELAVYGASDTMTPEDRITVAMEIEQIREDIFATGNTNMAGRYIFGGNRTDQPPFVDQNGTPVYQGAPGSGSGAVVGQVGTIAYEVGPGVTVAVAIHGDDAILPSLQALDRLSAALRADDSEEINAALGEVNSALDELLRWRAEVGSRMNRMEVARERLSEDRENVTSLLSDKQDVDIAETIMKLKLEENVYRSALAVGARILQPTLMDYLR